jgi:hypothetical protein
MKFIQIREEYLNLIPASVGKATRSAAAALLNYFNHQREGWLTFNLSQLCTTLLDQWGRETIRKAAQVLSELGLIERQHHRMNGRAWQYRATAAVPQKVATVAPDKVSVTLTQVTVASNKVAVTQKDAVSIYKDPLENPLENHQQHPAVASAAAEIEVKEIKVLAIKEIQEIECTPKIQINQQVKEAIQKNPENVEKAIALVKQAVQTWQVDNNFNWTGLLVKALKVGLEPYSAAAATQNELKEPSSPSGFKEWCEFNPLVKTAWYSQPFGEWVAVYQSGLQRPWYEAMGVQP